MADKGRKTALLVVTLLALGAHSAWALQCYQCSNLEIATDSSGIFGGMAGKSDPNCGMHPSQGNTVTCPGTNVCGSISAQISANSYLGKLSAKVQVRGCMPPLNDSPLGGCRAARTGDALLGPFMSLVARDTSVSGEVCTCSFDLCTLCAGGVELAGTCIQYWVLGLTGAGLIAVVLLLITCCCCCCGCCAGCCCRNRRQGVVHSGPYHTLTVIQPASGVAAGGLSIQSGDVTPRTNYPPPGAASSGYNQSNDAATLNASYTMLATQGLAPPGYIAAGYNPTNHGPPAYKPTNQGPSGCKGANQGPPGYTDDGFGVEGGQGHPGGPQIV